MQPYMNSAPYIRLDMQISSTFIQIAYIMFTYVSGLAAFEKLDEQLYT